jgi:signal transduction histidine kinase
MLGYRSAAEVLALSLSHDVCACGGRGRRCLCAISGRVVKDLEVDWKRRDGGRITVRLNGRAVIGTQAALIDLVAEDVTPRKQAERRVAQLNRLYGVLSRVNAATVRVRDRDALFGEVCRIAVDEGLFRMAWIGLLDPGTSRVRPIAHAGYETGYLDGIRAAAPDRPEGGGPIGTAVRTGRHAISEDIANDPAMLSWRSEALERGYRCCGAFPIAVRGRAVGALSLYSFEIGFFDRENVELLDRLTGDLSFALESMEAEQDRRRAELESKALGEELRRTNLELREQNRRARQATRLKSEFLANMSHEFRSPLNCIIGFSELIHDGRSGPLNGEQREYMQDILDSARHLLGLINDVLDLNRVECGRMEFHAEPVSLTRLVREVIDVLRALSSLKRIEIAADVSPDADSAELDPARFKQVLYNYLSNALKFTPEGGSVTVRIVPEGDSEVRLEVEDTGIGIEKGQVGRLFVEFGQLDAATSKRFQGSGLGLALTQRLVTLQGGRVGVESVPGLGSTFWAVLPGRAAKGAELAVR